LIKEEALPCAFYLLTMEVEPVVYSLLINDKLRIVLRNYSIIHSFLLDMIISKCRVEWTNLCTVQSMLCTFDPSTCHWWDFRGL